MESDSKNSNKRLSDTVESPEIFKKFIPNERDETDRILNTYRILGHEAIKMRLVSQSSDLLTISPNVYFAPEYTDEISNEEEEIIGYKDLKINIDFMAASLHANITISYMEKQEHADDLLEKFDKIFESGFCTNKNDFSLYFEDERTFKPYGTLIKEFEQDNETYNIYSCDFSTPGFSQYNKRLQVFLKFFINGANYVDEEPQWKYYIIYQLKDQRYNLIGFCSVYSFYQNLYKFRNRISQFLILPPFQRKGLGLSLLRVIYDIIQEEPNCFQVTVEDSSIAFQNLRDIKDVELIIKDQKFNWIRNKENNNPINIFHQIDKDFEIKEICKLSQKYKITINQVKRAVEILKYVEFEKNEKIILMLKKEIKERLKKANKEEFFPFENKKIPYVVFDGKQAIINPQIYKSANPNEVEAKLEQYYHEIIEDYETIKPKIKKIIQSNKNI